MPNEFIARNGIISRGNLVVSGSVVSTSPASFSGSLSLTGSLNIINGGLAVYSSDGSKFGSITTDNTFTYLNTNGGIGTHIRMYNVANTTQFLQDCNFLNGASVQGSPWYGYVLSLAKASYPTNDYLRWEVGKINSSGSFGIGTLTPSASLHISGSSGSVLFEIDSPAQQNILFVSGSGRVGLGTSAPGRTLEVFKGGLVDGSIDGIRITVNHGSATAQAALEFYHQAGPNPNSRIATDVGSGGLSPSMYFFHNGSNRIIITSGGNVLIGTSTNSARLAVQGSGTTSSTTSLLVQNSNATASLSVKDDGTTAVVSSNENPFTVSHTNGNSKLSFVLGNGSAIASGQTALRINDTLNVFTFDTGRIQVALPMTVGGPTGTFRISGGGGGSNVASPAIFLTDNTYNAGGYTVTSGTQTTVQIGGFGAASNSIWKPASGSANYTLLAVAPNMSGSGTYSGTIRGIYYAPTVDSTTYGAHRAIETTAGDVVFNGGNVGIGTSTPSASLHISGSSNSALFEIDSPAVNNILYVSGSGNVGIGTGTPTSRLTIENGNISFGSSTSGSNLFINGGNGNASSDLYLLNLSGRNNVGFAVGTKHWIQFGIGSNPATTSGIAGINLGNNNFESGLIFATSTGGNGLIERMRVWNDGNISIGNTSSSARLFIRGVGSTSSTTSVLVQNSGAGEAFKITDDRTTTISGTQTNLSTTNVYVGALSLTSAGVGVTGQGIWSTGTDGQMVLAGSLGGFVFKSWANSTIGLLNTANPRNLFSIQQYGFSDGNTNGLTGNTMNIAPIYNFTGVQASATVRGIYYNPTLTSLVNTTHIALETVTGNVLLGTTSGNVGIRTISPSFTLDVSGSGRFTNNLTVTGSFTVVTGSTVEFQVNQTGVKIGNATTDSHAVTGSVSISSSFSTSGSALTVYKSGSSVVDIQGSQGQLFSVIDALSGSLMSVNDVSGLPILEVFSDDRVVMGTYGAPGLTVSGSLATVATGSSAPTGTAPEGTFRFAIAGGLYYIYAYIGGAWRSGSLT
jgi:hypothetical protein